MKEFVRLANDMGLYLLDKGSLDTFSQCPEVWQGISGVEAYLGIEMERWMIVFEEGAFTWMSSNRNERLELEIRYGDWIYHTGDI